MLFFVVVGVPVSISEIGVPAFDMISSDVALPGENDTEYTLPSQSIGVPAVLAATFQTQAAVPVARVSS